MRKQMKKIVEGTRKGEKDTNERKETIEGERK